MVKGKKHRTLCEVKLVLFLSENETGKRVAKSIGERPIIQIVEENGQIVEIGEWVLRKVCEQNKAWQSAGYPPLKCAINLSPRHFNNKNLIETVKQILKETELDPSYLCFEFCMNLKRPGWS